MDGSFIQPYSFVHFNIVQWVLHNESGSYNMLLKDVDWLEFQKYKEVKIYCMN